MINTSCESIFASHPIIQTTPLFTLPCAFPAEGPLVRAVQLLLRPPDSPHSRQHAVERLPDFVQNDIANFVGHGDFSQQFLIFRAFARTLAFFDHVDAQAIFLVAVANRCDDIFIRRCQSFLLSIAVLSITIFAAARAFLLTSSVSGASAYKVSSATA